MATKKITLNELRKLVKQTIKEESQIQKITEKDFMKNGEFVINDIKVVLNKLKNPDYFIARYYDVLNNNELISSYGSPNYYDVIYDVTTSTQN